MKKLFSVVGAAAVAAGVFSAPAQALPPNCQSQFWLYGGLLGRGTQRVLCDGPIEADGSWWRVRAWAFYAPAGAVTNCGTYSCYTRYLPELGLDNTGEKYIVTPDTVLPDEPGHIG